MGRLCEKLELVGKAWEVLWEGVLFGVSILAKTLLEGEARGELVNKSLCVIGFLALPNIIVSLFSHAERRGRKQKRNAQANFAFDSNRQRGNIIWYLEAKEWGGGREKEKESG